VITSTPCHPDPGLPAALRAAALGLCCLSAAIELIIGNAAWLHRSDFTAQFINHHASGIDGYELAEIHWAAAISALDAGHLPCSSGEQHMLRLAASIADGIPISLQHTLTNLDHANVDLLITAIRQAAGQPPATGSFMID
jgi:hypothetical protein